MDDLIIEIVRDPIEAARVSEFVNTIAYNRHQASPPPPPDILFGAYYKRGVVGSAGLDFWDDKKDLPLKQHWRFDQTPLPCSPETTVQIGRWMAIRPGISFALLYAAAIFSRSRRKSYFIAEAKPKIIEVLRDAGFTAYRIENAALIMEKIYEGGRSYYLSDPPSLYMFDLAEMIEVAASKIKPPTQIHLEWPD